MQRIGTNEENETCYLDHESLFKDRNANTNVVSTHERFLDRPKSMVMADDG